MTEMYNLECGMHDAWYMVEHIVNEGVLAEDGGVEDGNYMEITDYWYRVDKGYCPEQDRTYLTMEIEIHTEDGKVRTKVLPCGWYQGDGDYTEDMIGDLVGEWDFAALTKEREV